MANPPTASGINKTVPSGTSIPLSQLITYSPGAGSTVVGFDFDQVTSNGGYITDNFGNILSSNNIYGNTTYGIPINELSEYHFIAGPAGTSDTIHFNVDDADTQYSIPAAVAIVTIAAPEPTLSYVSPNPVPESNSEQTIKLYGSNFVSGDSLYFTYPGGSTNNLNPISVVSSTEIDYNYFNDQNGSGSWTVQVKSPDGTLSDAASFTVSAPVVEPTLSYVSPNPVPESSSEQTIKLYGSNFVSGDSLYFTYPGGSTNNLNPISVVSSTEIDYNYFNDQNGSGSWTVQVKSPDGTLSDAASFQVATATSPYFIVPETSGGITIDLEFVKADQPTASFEADVENAAKMLATAIHNQITVNIIIGYGEFHGQTLTGGVAEASPDNGQQETYSSVSADLIKGAAPGDTTFNALPTGSSIQGQSEVEVWNAQLKLFNLLGANDTSTDDGYAGFATGISDSEMVGVALHELTHAMGRVPYGPEPDIFDFGRFTSAGVRLFDDSADTAPAAYFSVDGGNTDLADYGENSDSSDFLNDYPNSPPYSTLTPEDPFDEHYDASTTQDLTTVDLAQLDALGFNISAPGGGSGTALAGFDSEFFPAHADTMSWLKTNTNLAWCGYYLDAPSQRLDTGWLGERSYLTSLNWNIAPIYVGQQDPSYNGGNLSYSPSSQQGIADGNDAVAQLGPATNATETVYDYDATTAKYDIPKTVTAGQGFAAGTTVFLDLEFGDIATAPNSSADEAYILSWCQTVAGAGYNPGIYCPYSDAAPLQTILQQQDLTVAFWVADPNWLTNDPTEFTVGPTNFPTPNPATVSNQFTGSGYASATAWQYETGYSIQTVNGAYSIDLDSSTLYTASSNDTVSETAPTSVVATASQTFTFTGGNAVQVIDAGAGSDSFTTIVTANTGVVSASGTGVSGAGTNSVTLTGTLSQVNAALATLSYSNARAGTDTVSVTTSDSANQSSAVKNISVTINGQANLTEYVTVSNTTVAAGGSTTVGAYAMNLGSGAAGASTAGIYLSTDSTITTSDTLLTTVTSPGLNPVSQSGYYDLQNVSVALPSNLAAGTYYIGGIADYNDALSESSYTDNTYNVVAITVTAPAAPAKPNLSEYVTVSNTTVAAGGSTTVGAYAMNLGSGAAGASTAGIYLSTDSTITTSDTLLTTVTSPGLNPVSQSGYYDLQNVSVALPSNLAAGTYYIGGIADYNDALSESSYTDNTYNVVAITVTAPAAPAKPNLSEYVTVSNTTVAAGGSTTVGAYAMNLGSGAAGASTAGIYLSTDSTITTSDTLLTTVTSPGLNPVSQSGYYDLQNVSVALPSNLAAGTYYIGGIADYNDTLSESSYTDNTYNVVAITVTAPAAPAKPNLSEYVTVSNTTVAAGGSTTVGAYAMNLGSGAAGASTAGIYLSTDSTITTSDTLLTTVTSPGLNPVSQSGYYDLQNVSVALPSNLAAGTYYIGGIADYNDTLSESSYTDNTYNVVAITVTAPAAPAKPNLSEYVTVSNTTVAAGGSTTVGAYAMNLGSGAAGASTAGIYLSTDSTITTSDTLLTTVTSPGLNPVSQSGYYDLQNVSVALPSNLAAGTYYIGGIADYNDTLSESSYTDNTYNVVAITVTAPVQIPAVTLNDAAMWSAGALTVVNTFNGNGGTVTDIGPVSYGGFSLTNLDRSDFALTSLDSSFAAANGYFFDGTHVVDVPSGGTIPTADTIQIQQQNGDLFSVQSIELDTIFSATGQSATFTGVKADNSTVSQTFNLDSVQGLQTFQFSNAFDGLKSLSFAPTMNEYFDNIVLDPTSTSGAQLASSSDSAVSSTTIEAGQTLELDSPFSGTATFAGTTGTLVLDNSSSFTGTVAGLAGQDALDLTDINFATLQPLQYSGAATGGALSVTDGSHSADIALLGNYMASTFMASSDGHGGTSIVDPPAASASQNALLTQPQHA